MKHGNIHVPKKIHEAIEIQNHPVDLFQPDYWPGGMVTTRNWHVNFVVPKTSDKTRDKASDKTSDKNQTKTVRHKIVLRLSTATGTWIIIVDGVPILRGIENVVTSRKFNIELDLGDGIRLDVICNGLSRIKYHYSLLNVLEGVIYKEQRKVHGSGEDRMDYNVPVSVVIPDTRTFTDTEEKKTTLYQLCVCTSMGLYTIVERRFSQFDLLDQCIRSGLKQHVAVNLPLLPPKVTAPWVDQFSEGFTNTRRIHLEKYITEMVNISKV